MTNARPPGMVTFAMNRKPFTFTVFSVLSLAVSTRAADHVAGTLVQVNPDGCWSWYMDERAIVDPANGHLLVSSEASSRVAGVKPGSVRVTTWDLTSGDHRTQTMGEIQEDDHNAGGLIVLPDGRYLTMYSNHGNSRMGDTFSRYRLSARPHDSAEWTPEKRFDWSTTPGWAREPYPRNNVSYHNLYYLSAEDRLYDFSRGTHQAMNILTFDWKTDAARWAGQFEQSAVTGYGQGYFKFASNGVDRIYFIGTETHPRGCNTSIYSGYIRDGKSHAMDGTVLDDDVFDSVDSKPGAVVPDIASFTVVRRADPEGTGYNRLWTSDLELGPNGTLAALFTSRAGSSQADHRLHYARWDGHAWHAHEIARMGPKIYETEEDYTGIGAVVPGDPNTLYIATPVSPADGKPTAHREIYKGVTRDEGATWAWSALTSDSTVDNFRPIVPKWDGRNAAVLWFRGTYTTAQNINAAVVGVLDRPGESVAPARFISASDTDRAAPPPRLAAGTYDVFACIWGSESADWHVNVALGEGEPQLVRRCGAQQTDASDFDPQASPPQTTRGEQRLYRIYLGRRTLAADQPPPAVRCSAAPTSNAAASLAGVAYAPLSTAHR